MERPAPSVSTVLWDGHPFDAALDALAAAGLPLVEPAFIDGYVDFTEADLDERSAARLRAAIDARGLSVHGVSAHIDLGRDGAGERLARRIDFAAGLGAACLVTNAGAAADEARILATIEAAVPRLETAGLVLALENPGHGRGALIPHGAAGAKLVRRLGRPDAVRLNHDLGNAWTYNGGRIDLAADLKAALPHLAFVHLKDVESVDEDWRFVPVGTGEVGARAALERLLAHEPRPVVGLEMPLRLWRPGRGDPVRRAEPLPLETIDAALARALEALGVGDGAAAGQGPSA